MIDFLAQHRNNEVSANICWLVYWVVDVVLWQPQKYLTLIRLSSRSEGKNEKKTTTKELEVVKFLLGFEVIVQQRNSMEGFRFVTCVIGYVKCSIRLSRDYGLSSN